MDTEGLNHPLLETLILKCMKPVLFLFIFLYFFLTIYNDFQTTQPKLVWVNGIFLNVSYLLLQFFFRYLSVSLFHGTFVHPSLSQPSQRQFFRQRINFVAVSILFYLISSRNLAGIDLNRTSGVSTNLINILLSSQRTQYSKLLGWTQTNSRN